MRRKMSTAALALAVASTMVVAGCSSKSDTGTTGGSTGTSTEAATGGALSIQPLVQVNSEGTEVPAADTSKAADPAGDGSAKCDSGLEIAMAGALTGANAALGKNILNGAQLAIDEHNKANAGCQVTLKQFDTEGDPQKATQVIPSITGDKAIIGLLGPAFSGETKATGATIHQAGLLSLTASATNPTLTQNGWTNFFRGLGNDNSQGGAVANYMTKTLGYSKVCVVEDDSDYGIGLAEVVTKTLGSAADSSCAGNVKTGDKDFSALVQSIKDAAPQAVYYGGYYAEAAPFVSQLRSAGVTAAFVSGDGTNDPQFVSQAGDASKDAYLTCPCGPAPEAFATKYKAAVGADPGVYSVQAYDLVTIMLKGIDSGATTREKLIDFVKSYSGQGLAGEYKWESDGELPADITTTWIYQVK